MKLEEETITPWPCTFMTRKISYCVCTKYTAHSKCLDTDDIEIPCYFKRDLTAKRRKLDEQFIRSPWSETGILLFLVFMLMYRLAVLYYD